MNWTEALEQVVARTGHLRYRELCADSNPDHRTWRARMVEQATGIPTEPEPGPRLSADYPPLGSRATSFAAPTGRADYPPLAAQAATFVASMGHAAVRVATGRQVRATPEQYQARLAICRTCIQFDSSTYIPPGRCRLCGCATMGKLTMAHESCPLPEPKWGPVS